MKLVIKYKPTIEKQLLTPLAYKIVQWIALCEFLIVLSLPWLWFKLIGFKCRRFKLFLGAILALIICFILFFILCELQIICILL